MDRGGFRAGEAVQGGAARAVQGVEADEPPAGCGAEGAYRVPPRRRGRRGHPRDRQGLQCPRRDGAVRASRSELLAFTDENANCIATIPATSYAMPPARPSLCCWADGLSRAIRPNLPETINTRPTPMR